MNYLAAASKPLFPNFDLETQLKMGENFPLSTEISCENKKQLIFTIQNEKRIKNVTETLTEDAVLNSLDSSGFELVRMKKDLKKFKKKGIEKNLSDDRDPDLAGVGKELKKRPGLGSGCSDRRRGNSSSPLAEEASAADRSLPPPFAASTRSEGLNEEKGEKIAQVTKKITLTHKIALRRLQPTSYPFRPSPTDFYRDYHSEIADHIKGPQYILIADVTKKLFFSQTNVSNFYREGCCDMPISSLAESMFLEFKRDFVNIGDGALDVVNMNEGKYTSLDNRRLLIAKKISQIDRTYGIWIKVHNYDDKLSPFSQRRLNAGTWGEAVEKRINNPKRPFGYSKLPLIQQVKINGLKQEQKTITLTIDHRCNLNHLNKEDRANIISNMDTNRSIDI